MASIGDVFLRVLADMRGFEADIVKTAGKSGDKAGLTLGQRIKGSLSKSNIKQGLLQGLGFGAGFGAVNVFTQAIGGLVTAMNASVEAASNQREAVSLSTQVFEEQTEAVDNWADGAAEAFGQSKTEALNYASSFGTAFKNVGFALDETADKSMELTRLAADLGSAFNASSEEAAIAIRSGLLGESEPLRRFGVFLSEAAVKQEAYASGIAEVGDELTNQQKVLARYNIIMRQTADSQGMFGRDTESLADAQKRFGAELENVQAKIGTKLIPVMVMLVEKANELVDAVTLVSEATDKLGDIPGGQGTVDLFGHFLDPSKWLDVNGAAEAYLDTIQGFGVDTSAAREEFRKLGLQVETSAEQIEASADELDIARNLTASFVRGSLAAEAAAHQLAVGVESALDNVETIVKSAGEAIPLAYAEGILAKQSEVKTAMAALINQMETEMSRGEEIAYLIGVLTSEELAEGLKDKRPGVRAQAENTRKVAEDRLKELLPQGKFIGGKANEKLAEGMDSKKPAVRNAANRTRRIIETSIKPNTKPAGNAAVNGLVAQLNAGRGRVGTAAARLAQRIISNIVAEVRRSSGVTRSGPLVQERAIGGPVYPGQAYIVGERRPELFVPDVPGRIRPSVPPLSEPIPLSGGGPQINLQTYGLPMRAETPAEVLRRIRRGVRMGTVATRPKPGTWEQ